MATGRLFISFCIRQLFSVFLGAQNDWQKKTEWKVDSKEIWGQLERLPCHKAEKENEMGTERPKQSGRSGPARHRGQHGGASAWPARAEGALLRLALQGPEASVGTKAGRGRGGGLGSNLKGVAITGEGLGDH